MIKKLSLLLSIALLTFVSCNKMENGNADGGQTDGKTAGVEHVCVSDSLLHHKAKAATFHEFGNIDYWECLHCRRCYHDKGMNEAVTGTPLLLPLKYGQFKKSIGDLFGDEEAFLAEVEANHSTKPSTKCLHRKAGNGLSRGADKTGDGSGPFFVAASAISLLQSIISGTLGYVEATSSDGYGGRKETIDSISVMLADIESTIDDMDAKMDEISDLVNDIYYDVPELINYSTAINDRYRDLANLGSETFATLLIMDKYQDSFPTPVSQADSAQLESLWKSAVKEWAEYDNGYYLRLTEDLLAKYTYPLSTHPELNYPQVLKAFTNYYAVVETDSYAFRGLNLAIDALEVTGAYLLYSLYYYYMDDLSEVYKKKILNKVSSDYDAYLAAMEADIEERYYNYKNYYIISTEFDGQPVVKYFSRTEAKILDFEGYVKQADQRKKSFYYYDPYTFICPYPYICLDFLNENNVSAESVLTVEDMDLINASLNEGGSGKQSLKDYFGGRIDGIPDNKIDLLLYAYTNYSCIYQDPIWYSYGYGDESGMYWDLELHSFAGQTGDPTFGFYWYDEKGNYRRSVYFARINSKYFCRNRADFMGDGTDVYNLGQDKVWTLNCVKIETQNY